MMEFPKKIAIGADHAGFVLKEIIKLFLEKLDIEIHDFGTHSIDSVDYPDFAHAVAEAIEAKEFEFGILICGTANGISIAANKHQKIRSAVVWRKDIAELARKHNDANIICLPARFIEEELAIACIQAFLTSDFEGGRHATRVSKISC